jgi:hypothetical protein
MLTCTRCEGSGFLSANNIPDAIWELDIDKVLAWVLAHPDESGDATVCDCCGDGEESWYGQPGEHYGPDDPPGAAGPYASNGGLCHCH